METTRSPVIRPAFILFVSLTLITGVIYPLAVTGIAQGVFPDRANGSLVAGVGGAPIGSSLIGQEFSAGDPKSTARYFWGRLSATGPVPYTSFNGEKLTGSSGSNLAPTNPVLVDNARARIDALQAADTAVGYERPSGQKVPIDLVTSSGSGLDPHISPAAAEYQVPRVARARGLSEAMVREAVQRHSDGRTFGLLGEPVVHVLRLNLDLDSMPR